MALGCFAWWHRSEQPEDGNTRTHLATRLTAQAIDVAHLPLRVSIVAHTCLYVRMGLMMVPEDLPRPVTAGATGEALDLRARFVQTADAPLHDGFTGGLSREAALGRHGFRLGVEGGG